MSTRKNIDTVKKLAQEINAVQDPKQLKTVMVVLEEQGMLGAVYGACSKEARQNMIKAAKELGKENNNVLSTIYASVISHMKGYAKVIDKITFLKNKGILDAVFDKCSEQGKQNMLKAYAAQIDQMDNMELKSTIVTLEKKGILDAVFDKCSEQGKQNMLQVPLNRKNSETITKLEAREHFKTITDQINEPDKKEKMQQAIKNGCAYNTFKLLQPKDQLIFFKCEPPASEYIKISSKEFHQNLINALAPSQKKALLEEYQSKTNWFQKSFSFLNDNIQTALKQSISQDQQNAKDDRNKAELFSSIAQKPNGNINEPKAQISNAIQPSIQGNILGGIKNKNKYDNLSQEELKTVKNEIKNNLSRKPINYNNTQAQNTQQAAAKNLLKENPELKSKLNRNGSGPKRNGSNNNIIGPGH